MDVTELKTAQVELLHSEQRRRRALTQILQAETAERARIANDLHDDTIQVMTAALIWLDRAAGSLGRGESIAVDTAIGEIRRTLGLAMECTRRLAFEMRPQLLHAAGLGPAIRGLAGGQPAGRVHRLGRRRQRSVRRGDRDTGLSGRP